MVLKLDWLRVLTARKQRELRRSADRAGTRPGAFGGDAEKNLSRLAWLAVPASFNFFQGVSFGFRYVAPGEREAKDRHGAVQPESRGCAQYFHHAWKGLRNQVVGRPQGHRGNRHCAAADAGWIDFADYHPGHRTEGDAEAGNVE